MAPGPASLPPLDVTRAPEGGEVGAIQSGWRLALREFMSNRLAVVGVAILLFFTSLGKEDYPVLLAYTLIGAVFVVLGNFVADIALTDRKSVV